MRWRRSNRGGHTPRLGGETWGVLCRCAFVAACFASGLSALAQVSLGPARKEVPEATAKDAATIVELGKQLESVSTDWIDKEQILSAITDLYAKTLDWARAVPFYERLASLSENSNDLEEAAYIFGKLGLLYEAHKDGLGAAAAFEREAALELRAGNRIGAAQAFVNEGFAAESADWKKAVGAYERVPTICGALADSTCLAVLALRASGNVYARHGDPQSAIPAYEKSIALATKLGDLDGKAEALDDLANVYDDTGEWQKAVASLRSEALVRHEAGSLQSEGLALNRISPIYVLHGEWRKAVESDQQAASAFAAAGNLGAC